MRAASLHHTRPCRGRPGLQALTPIGSVRCWRPGTSWRHGHSSANPDERHGERANETMVGKLREDMGRESHAVEGILRHGCGYEAISVPGSTVRAAKRRRSDADRGVLTLDAAGAALSVVSVMAAL
jgi:hypothetical protein